MKITRAVAVAVGGMLVVSAAMVGQATAKQDKDQFAKVRKATAQYHNEAKAAAAGYTRSNQCVPQMGYHYVNEELLRAPLDPLKPAILLYAPHGKDGRKLIGVEYFVRDADQRLDTHNDPVPSMFGQRFAGPMPGHGGAMPAHYDLHAYIWTTNPNGTLAESNPEVICP
jgi:hypothetical protein